MISRNSAETRFSFQNSASFHLKPPQRPCGQQERIFLWALVISLLSLTFALRACLYFDAKRRKAMHGGRINRATRSSTLASKRGHRVALRWGLRCLGELTHSAAAGYKSHLRLGSYLHRRATRRDSRLGYRLYAPPQSTTFDGILGYCNRRSRR